MVHPAFKWIWASPYQHKHKVFFWLLLKDRLSTRNVLRRKNMVIDSYNCVLCSCSVEETTQHLFLSYNFAKQCRNILGINLSGNNNFPVITSILKAKLQSKFFMVVVILMCWSVWTARKDLIFNGTQPEVEPVILIKGGRTNVIVFFSVIKYT